jgi:hypothetical protein
MPLLSCHEPGTTKNQGGSVFLLRDLCCCFSTVERREAAVADGADRILCFLIENTAKIGFVLNFNWLWQFRTRKLPYCAHNNFFREQLALPSGLNIGAGVLSPIRRQN